MTITPEGHPAWVRNASVEIYGGHAEGLNHLGGGLVNARTDVGQRAYSRLAMYAAASARVRPYVILELTMNSAGNPTVEWASSMTARSTFGYSTGADPVGLPDATTVAAGTVDLTFDASHADAYGVTVATNITHAEAGAASVLGDYYGEAEVTSPTVVRVYNRDRLGALADSPLFVAVWLGY